MLFRVLVAVGWVAIRPTRGFLVQPNLKQSLLAVQQESFVSQCATQWPTQQLRVGYGHARCHGMHMMFDQLTSKLSSIGQLLAGRRKITAESIEPALVEVRSALLDADVSFKVVTELVDNVKKQAVGADLVEGVTPDQQFVKIMYDELVRVMGQQKAPLAKRAEGAGPTVVLMAGLQGAGKTTAAAKLAKFCQEEVNGGAKVLLVAADVYRPAAIDQLQILGKKIGVEVFSQGQDANPVDVAGNATAYARENGIDTVIVDTAGRQVVDDKLMVELKNIKEAVQPDEVLLVVDAMTGQEAATLTAVFNERIGITGAVLTKLDGDTRGGSAISVQSVSGKPIKFVGVGERLEDLEPFYPDRMASRILGMGDVVTLVEKAQKEMSDADAQKLTDKMMEGKFDFDDFLKQCNMMKGMGSFAGIAKMLPGLGGKISQDKLDAAEERAERAEALIKVMLPEERKNPDLLIRDATANDRLRRIAKDAGMPFKSASAFVSEFQTMRSMMKKMSKGMAGGPEGEPKNDAASAVEMFGSRAERRAAKKKQEKEEKKALRRR